MIYFAFLTSFLESCPQQTVNIARPPRAFEVMERHKPVLHVHTGSHFEGAAHEHPHLTGADFCKQLFLPRLGVRLVDECDLLAGDSSGDELFPDVVKSPACRTACSPSSAAPASSPGGR